LLNDETHQICEAFGVWQEKTYMGKTKMGVVRSTFLIDEKGLIQWIESPVKVEGQFERVLEALNQLKSHA
jgi:thioredoxin-dependent peroxiredoxin